jgi:hypothetical protein
MKSCFVSEYLADSWIVVRTNNFGRLAKLVTSGHFNKRTVVGEIYSNALHNVISMFFPGPFCQS